MMCSIVHSIREYDNILCIGFMEGICNNFLWILVLVIISKKRLRLIIKAEVLDRSI